MQNHSIDSKLPTVERSIFSTMSALANEHNATNLSQGFPDFQCSSLLLDLVGKYMNQGFNQYAPSHGIPALRKQVSGLAKDLYGADYDFETEVTITSGATEALFCAISAIVQEGDEVIVFEPAYDSYVPVIELNGGNPIFVALETPGFSIDWEKFKKRVNSRTRMIILNSPHNPSGATLSAGDLEELQRIVKSNNIFILSDEVYEHIVFDGEAHQSVARFPDLRARSFIVSSFGKTFHATGWKVGYCLAPVALTKEFRKLHQFVTFSTSTPFQYAIAEYMETGKAISGIRDFYQKKRDFFREGIKGSKFKLLDCKGTYFQLLDYSALSTESDVDFARKLTVEHKLASIPMSVFYHNKEDNHILRFCFAKELDTLKKAIEVLRSL